MVINAISTIDSVKEAVLNTGLSHIAIIMDGNRRWAKSKSLPSMFGHKEGVASLKKVIQSANDFGVKYLTVYAFSTENWGRKNEEVDFLMNLLKNTVKHELKELYENKVKIKIIGDIEPLSNELKQVLRDTEELTAENTGLNLQIAINYGSRNEITQAVKKISQEVKSGKLEPENITDSLISDYLYTAGIPNPDLLIRTGGEQRISNYLLWQIAYTEIYVTDKFWPEFDGMALGQAIKEFEGRNRRFGKD